MYIVLKMILENSQYLLPFQYLFLQGKSEGPRRGKEVTDMLDICFFKS